MRPPSVAQFLNVDLDLRAPRDLAPFAAGLDGRVFVLRCEPDRHGGYVLSVELLERPWRSPTRSADAILAGFCALLEGLPAELRAVWDGCSERNFSIGFESACSDGRNGRVYDGRVSTETLRRVANLGGTLSVTIYPLLEVSARVLGRLGLARARNARRRHRVRVRSG